ncbi:MAG: DUF167 domain-containing protein [Campylobacterales bacterium]
MAWYTREGEWLLLAIRVTPGSSKSAIEGVKEGMLRIKLNAPPVDGSANKELIHLLSKEMKTAKSTIAIVAGENARTKRVRLPLTPIGEEKIKEWDETAQ